MDTSAPHTIVVVSHTHWDREWYHALPVMRHRLAALIDELLDAPDGMPFLLDGQAIILDDYRQVRPENASRLSEALRTGALEAGPWYVLSDMLLPSGEALVRNLLEGTRTVREAGGTPPPVLYSPDAFGHASAGPVLAEGFGFGVAVVWRGYGGPEHPASTVARWKHPSGATVLLYHLPPSGYELGASLPSSLDAAATRWRAMRDALLRDNPLGVALLPNGADHHARQSFREAAFAALATVAAPHIVEVDTLTGFATRLLQATRGSTLARVTGELRDSAGYAWALQGTFATRAHQKRTNAQVERLLVREAEPWAAMAWYTTGWSRSTMRSVWRTLLAAHPHDTLCGCSVDAVATAAELRFGDARAQATEVRDDAIRALVDCDVSVQRDLESLWRPVLLVRNPSSRARSGAVRLRLVDNAVADPVGPGSAARSGARVAPPAAGVEWSGDEKLQLLERARHFTRVESPLHYPRNAVTRVSEAMAWIDAVPGYGIVPVNLVSLHALVRPVPISQRVRGTNTEITGATWRVSTSLRGITAGHAESGARLQPVGWIESITDAGDTYTPSLRGEPTIVHWSSPRLTQRGPIRAEWEMTATIARARAAVAPATEPAARDLPPREMVDVDLTMTLALTAGTDWIDLTIRGVNRAGDHRVRWIVPLPASIRTDHVIADAAFGAVLRPSADREAQAWTAESRLHTAPLHRWLILPGQSYGIGVISDGLAEYELLPDGHLAITLVRAVGELSRRDLPERPGHAGWPAATPAAQSLGEFEARFALLALPHDLNTALAIVEDTADDVLLPMTGDTWRGVATTLQGFSGLTLEGEGLVFSAVKRSEDGEWLVLRCINQRDIPVRGVWHLPRAAEEVRLSRLDETPGLALTGTGPRIRFEAAAHEIVTLLVK
jgi:mannosylglycerate hydrolase